MQLVASYRFDDFGGRYSLLEVGDLSLWLIEREWNGNRRNVSCVPRGEYKLERHNGRKYRDTWALVGLTVGGGPTPLPGKTRYACVIHAAQYPSDLEGCLAPARAINSQGAAIDSQIATTRLLALLDEDETHDLILA